MILITAICDIDVSKNFFDASRNCLCVFSKIKELHAFLECAYDVEAEGCTAALDATRNLLSAAVLVLTNSRYQLNEVSVLHGHLESSFDSLLDSDHAQLRPQKSLAIGLTNVFAPSMIKQEIVPEEEGTPTGKLMMTRNDCFLCLAFRRQSVTFKVEIDLWGHIEHNHVVDRTSGPALSCAWCPKQYVLTANAELSGSVTRLFYHLLNAHSNEFTCPSYVASLLCDSKGCGYTAYAEGALQEHLNSRHSKEVAQCMTQMYYDESTEQSNDDSDEDYCQDEEDEEEEEEEEKIQRQAETSLSRTHSESLSRKVQFSQIRCFICKTEPEFSNEILVMNHIREEHLKAIGTGFILQCPLCYKSYKMTKSKSVNACLSESLTRYLAHLVDTHTTPVPDYIDSFKCSKCDFIGISPYLLHLHSLRHKKSTLTAVKKRKRIQSSEEEESEDVMAPCGVRGAVSRALQLSRHQCFICDNEFGDEDAWMEHVRDEHLIKKKETCLLSCSQCTQKYTIKALKLCKSYLSESLSRLLQHMMKKHSYPIPDYISTFTCHRCSYVALSPYILTMHSRLHKCGIEKMGNFPSLHPSPSRSVRRNSKKPRIEAGCDEEIDTVLTFPALSNGAESRPDPLVVAMKDRQVSVSENKCFLCPQEIDGDVRCHWRDVHLDTNSQHHAFLICPHCGYTLKVGITKLTPGNTSELMASLCHHLATQHPEVLIPDYVTRIPCPLPNCPCEFFSLHLYRQHIMRAHQIYSSRDSVHSGRYYVLIGDSPFTFTHYKCFLCGDDLDHLNVIAYLNHWVQQHFEHKGSLFVLDCAKCSSTSEACFLYADQIIMCIIQHAQHLLQDHGQALPPYLIEESQVSCTFDLSPDAKHYLVVRKSTKNKKTFHKVSGDDDFQSEFSMSSFTKYSSFSPSVSEAVIPGVEHLHDRQMSALEPKCFLCEDRSFPDQALLKRHWCEHHFDSTKPDLPIFNCPLCDHPYTLNKKVTPSIVGEIFSSFGVHLASRHSFEFPDYVVRLSCPVNGCVKVFFNAFQCRQHLRSHELVVSDLKRGEFVVSRNTSETFKVYKCFLCQDDVDHLSVLSFVNHWLEQHFDHTTLQLKCPDCELTTEMDSLRANVAMTLIIQLAVHRTKDHGMKMPSYIVEDSCAPELESVYHQPLSDAMIIYIPAMLEKRPQFTKCICFACNDDFPDTDQLLSHWTTIHSAPDEPSSVQCPQCTQKWATEPDGLAMLSSIAQHMDKTHTSNISSHVLRFPCPLRPCSEPFYDTDSLAKHVQVHRLTPVDYNGSLVWRLPVLPSHPMFTLYRCFDCLDSDFDHGSLVGFLSHWLTNHCFSSEDSTDELNCKCLKCTDCLSFKCSSMSEVNLSALMTFLGSYISHLVEDHDFSLPSYLTKPQQRVKMSAPSDATMAQLHDRQVTMTRLVCFQCNEDKLYLSKRALYEHWSTHHILSDSSKVSIRCKYCNMTYSSKKINFQVSRFFTMLSHYCGHLSRSHSLTLEYVVASSCPVYDCGFLAFALDGLRHHMKSHGWENPNSQDLKEGLVQLSVEHLLLHFRELRCFLCEDSSEAFSSPMLFMNHFLKTHFSIAAPLKRYTLKCRSCLYVSVTMTRIDLFQTMRGIHLLLIHMIRKHQNPVPDFLELFLCAVNNCAFTAITKKAIDAHERSHVTSISPDIPLDKYRELCYTERRCYLCLNQQMLYASEDDLSKHWQVTHMHKENQSHVLTCDLCTTMMQTTSTDDALLLATELFLHRLQEHGSDIPDYVAQLPCLKPACQFMTFLAQDLKQHEEDVHPDDNALVEVMDQEEAEEVEETITQPEERSLYDRRPLEMTMTDHICFLCSDNRVYQDLLSLTSHVMDAHFEVTEKFSAVLPCPFCFKKYSYKERSKSPSIVLQALSSLVQHMSERHDFIAPNYIERITCPQDGCEYQTFTTNRLASHLKLIHGIVDSKLGRLKGMSFSKGSSSHTMLTSKLVMKMKRYVCFECENSSHEFATYHEYAIHWREVHYEFDGDFFRKKCRACSHEYKVTKRKGQEASGMMESVSFYFMHLVNKHHEAVPDYIINYDCPFPECTFVTFTLFSIETHCKQKHKELHSHLIAQMEEQGDFIQMQFQTMPSTSTFGSQMLTLAPDPLQLATLEVGPPLTQSTYMCLKCGKDFPSLEEKNSHVKKTHDKVKRFLCHMCPESFSSEESYHEHMFRAHSIARAGEQAFYCDKCSFSTTFSSKLERHIYHKHQMSGNTGH